MKYNNREVIGFIYVHKYAKDILDQSNIIEMDSTFRSMKPYTAAIICCVKCNVTIPIGISCFYSENSDIYLNYFKFIQEYLNVEIRLKEKVFLSDLYITL